MRDSVANGSGTSCASNWIQSTSPTTIQPPGFAAAIIASSTASRCARCCSTPRACTTSNSLVADRLARDVEAAHFDDARARRLEARVDVDRHDAPRRPDLFGHPRRDRARARADVAAVPARRDADVGQARGACAPSATRASTRRRSCSRRIWSGSSLMRYEVGSSAHAAPPARDTTRRDRRAVRAGGRARARRSSSGASRSCRRRSFPRTARAARAATRRRAHRRRRAARRRARRVRAASPTTAPSAPNRRSPADRLRTTLTASGNRRISSRVYARARRWRTTGSSRRPTLSRERGERAVAPRRRVAAADDRRLRARAPTRAGAQPPSISPTTFSTGTRTSVRNTSLKCAAPVIWRSGPHVDPGRAQVEEEERDPAMLRRVGVRAREQDREVAQVRVRRPDLLPVDDELVAVALGARREVREVAPRGRLAEQLAPRLVGAQQRPQVPRPLRVAAVAKQHRADHADRRGDEARADREAGLLLGEDRRLLRRSRPGRRTPRATRCRPTRRRRARAARPGPRRSARDRSVAASRRARIAGAWASSHAAAVGAKHAGPAARPESQHTSGHV